ncbi:MAG: DUF3822 family protein [Bacteroidales bacterium]|jgi:hypothetical protein|nr:DUF3822 family protein [Bacteroidales bacterium]
MSFSLIHYIKTEGSFLPEEMRLSVCLKATGFSFSLIDKAFQLKAVGEFSVDLTKGISSVMQSVKQCFASLDIKNLKFDKVRIISLSDRQVWIPFKLYDKTQDKNYLTKVCNVPSSDTIRSSVVESIDAVSVFAISLNHYSGIKIAMPQAKYATQHEVLANHLFDISSFASNNLLLHKRGTTFDMMLFKSNNLFFSNHFVCVKPMDTVYYLLFALGRAGLDIEDVQLLITGDAYDKEEFDTLRRYAPNIAFTNPLENVKAGVEFDEVDLQPYFLLLA